VRGESKSKTFKQGICRLHFLAGRTFAAVPAKPRSHSVGLSVDNDLHRDVFLKVDETRNPSNIREVPRVPSEKTRDSQTSKKFRASCLKRCATDLAVNPRVGGQKKTISNLAPHHQCRRTVILMWQSRPSFCGIVFKELLKGCDARRLQRSHFITRTSGWRAAMG
jgi:hypothetical protein